MRLGTFETMQRSTRVMANVDLNTTPHLGIMLSEPGTLVVMGIDEEEKVFHNVPANVLIQGPFKSLLSPVTAMLVIK